MHFFAATSYQTLSTLQSCTYKLVNLSPGRSPSSNPSSTQLPEELSQLTGQCRSLPPPTPAMHSLAYRMAWKLLRLAFRITPIWPGSTTPQASPPTTEFLYPRPFRCARHKLRKAVLPSLRQCTVSWRKGRSGGRQCSDVMCPGQGYRGGHLDPCSDPRKASHPKAGIWKVSKSWLNEAPLQVLHVPITSEPWIFYFLQSSNPFFYSLPDPGLKLVYKWSVQIRQKMPLREDTHFPRLTRLCARKQLGGQNQAGLQAPYTPLSQVPCHISVQPYVVVPVPTSHSSL